jgi:ABC-type transport system involved in cytochrome bd biosynthesis fused ATPase/permease subunit
MILDEPTAGLDAETEIKVLNVLKSYSSRRTIIIATHRAAIINFSENIIDLNNL